LRPTATGTADPDCHAVIAELAERVFIGGVIAEIDRN